MGTEDQTGDKPIGDYLIVAARIPVGLIGAGVVTLFFVVWLILETVVLIGIFPFFAIFANKATIRESWLGRYPIALQEFSRDGFNYLRSIWEWVTDPAQGVDLTAPPPDHAQEESPIAGVMGCLLLVAIVGGVAYGIYRIFW